MIEADNVRKILSYDQFQDDPPWQFCDRQRGICRLSNR